MDIEIVVGRTFNSFDEIVMVKKELEKQKFYCLSFPEIRTVTSFNNTSVILFIIYIQNEASIMFLLIYILISEKEN